MYLRTYHGVHWLLDSICNFSPRGRLLTWDIKCMEATMFLGPLEVALIGAYPGSSGRLPRTLV